MIYEVVT